MMGKALGEERGGCLACWRMPDLIRTARKGTTGEKSAIHNYENADKEGSYKSHNSFYRI